MHATNLHVNAILFVFFLLACMHATNLHVNAMLFVFFSTCMHACYKSACPWCVVRFFILLACMHATNLHVNAMLFVFFLLACMHATNLHVNAMLLHLCICLLGHPSARSRLHLRKKHEKTKI